MATAVFYTHGGMLYLAKLKHTKSGKEQRFDDSISAEFYYCKETCNSVRNVI